MRSQIRTEQLMRNSAAKNSGWTSCVQNGCVNRIIQIGTRKNCNQDVLIKIPQIETNIRDIMSKYIFFVKTLGKTEKFREFGDNFPGLVLFGEFIFSTNFN